MSKMELRSSRSRSITPFKSQEFVDNEISSEGDLVERTVLRTTRRTTIYKNNEIATSSGNEVTSHYSDQQAKLSHISGSKSEKSLDRNVITSDYSSEDGENEVSSTRILRQNEVNQFVEQAKTLINGNEMSALDLYKKSGRYWEVYPKTDWTYSQHSKDRVEIAPGVVAMPNMSRKTIHSLDEFGQQSYQLNSSSSLYSENVAHKNIDTDDLYTRRYINSESLQRNIFNNNAEDYYIKRRSFSYWTMFKSTVFRIITSIFSLIYYLYFFQTIIFSTIHRTASKVMLWDTYLMWKSKPGDKATKLVLLCLLPLTILSGLWFASSLGSIAYGLLSNYSSSASYIPLFGIWSNKPLLKNDHNDPDIIEGSNTHHRQRGNFDTNIQLDTNNYLPLLSPSEIAASLTNNQLEYIANIIKDSIHLEHTNEVNSNFVENIIKNPNFQTMINNYAKNTIKLIEVEQENSKFDTYQLELLKKHELIISNLLKEIDSIKAGILQNNQQNIDQLSRLTLDIKRCSNKKSVVDIKGYISNILTNMLNNHDFLRNQQGLNDWLRSIFIAKLQLEYYVGNVTSNMDDKMTNLIRTNSQVIMDQVATKLTEFNNKRGNKEDHEMLSELSEDDIKKVVKRVLTVYDADKTGLVDFAMESMGGQILTTRCTELYHSGKAVVSILGVPLWYPSNSPRTIIRPSIAPGECWAFQNFPGFVVIKLSTKVKLEAFSMEHISRLLVPEGKIDSAPKQFEVYGLQKENDRNPILLGTYTYDYNGDSLQFFAINTPGLVFDMVELRVTSNHGNPNYTCLYRFRVHGQIYHESNR